MEIRIIEDTSLPEEIIKKEQNKILELSKDGIIPTTDNLYNDIYTTYTGKYKSKSFDVTGVNYTYIVTKDSKNNIHISSNCKDEDELYEVMSKIIKYYNPNRMLCYLYKDCDIEGYIKEYNKYNDNFISDPNERLEYMNSEWLKKHKINNMLDLFSIRELTENDVGIQLAYLNEFKNSKDGVEDFSYYNLYKKIIKTNMLNNRVGLFYNDLLLGYREANIFGDTAYVITENCISNIKTEFLDNISKVYSKYRNLDRLKVIISESNEIADKIMELKKDKKWKQAKELTKNKKFKASLEEPYNINKKEIYLELLNQFENSDKLFLKTNIKQLLIYKYNEYMKNKNIRYFSVDKAVDEHLYNYKINTNTLAVKYVEYKRRK